MPCLTVPAVLVECACSLSEAKNRNSLPVKQRSRQRRENCTRAKVEIAPTTAGNETRRPAGIIKMKY